MVNLLCRMVSTRTSSKKSGTGSTPPTGEPDLCGEAKPIPGSPCSVAKKTIHTRDIGGDMFSDQKIMPEHNTSQEKARTEKAPASSAEQSTELTVCPKLVVALNWYFCISLHFKGVWVNLMLV